MASPRYTLYTVGTPNVLKVTVVLEELGQQYTDKPVDLGKTEQKEQSFLDINPNGRVPALVDHANGDEHVWETGSIMVYLCEQHDSPMLPKDRSQRAQVFNWLFWQMAGVGPMFGQAAWFIRSAPDKAGVKDGYAMKRYTEEGARLIGVVESVLADGREWLVGSSFTLAEASIVPWFCACAYMGLRLEEFPKVKAWVDRSVQRPAFQKALGSSMVKGLLSPEAAEGAYQSAQKIMREAGAFDQPQGSVSKPSQAQH